MIPIGQVISQRRRQLGISQQTLATAVGVNQATISKVERGTLSPTAQQILRIADALHTSPADLFVQDPYRPSTDWFGIETLRQLGQLNLQGEFQEMRRLIHSVTHAPFFKMKRNRLELLYWKAVTLNALGHHQDAIDLGNAFIAENPNYPDTKLTIKYRIVIGHALRSRGDYESSKHHLETAALTLQSRPEIIESDIVRELLYNLGCTYAACTEVKRAMETFTRLRGLQEEDKVTRLLQSGDTLIRLAKLLEKQGMLEQALTHYQLARREYANLDNAVLVESVDAFIHQVEKLLCVAMAPEGQRLPLLQP